jgi:hypothetical protein
MKLPELIFVESRVSAHGNILSWSFVATWPISMEEQLEEENYRCARFTSLLEERVGSLGWCGWAPFKCARAHVLKTFEDVTPDCQFSWVVVWQYRVQETLKRARSEIQGVLEKAHWCPVAYAKDYMPMFQEKTILTGASAQSVIFPLRSCQPRFPQARNLFGFHVACCRCPSSRWSAA